MYVYVLGCKSAVLEWASHAIWNFPRTSGVSRHNTAAPLR